MNEYPRETNEPIPFTVILNGVPVTDPAMVQVTTTAHRDRPANWVTPVQLADGRLAIPLAGQLPGILTAWARPSAAPWSPVIELGLIRVT